ncbi:hypothetical protein BURPS305_0264 [Burkholderia pseudomallei 305]|nr:hypothetical protein BURPS305_0264 [Burkholderia pseudomallei 305]
MQGTRIDAQGGRPLGGRIDAQGGARSDMRPGAAMGAGIGGRING